MRGGPLSFSAMRSQRKRVHLGDIAVCLEARARSALEGLKVDFGKPDRAFGVAVSGQVRFVSGMRPFSL